MFTGLIEEIGEIASLRRTSSGVAVSVRAPRLAPEVRPGNSVAVSGVCLTVETAQSGLLAFHVGQETVQRSTAGAWQAGQRVNLERALAAGGRLGGHFVQGHVDATGTVTGVRREGETVWLSLSFPPEGAPYLVEKGSLAVEGVSLTIATLGPRELSIAVIPFTWDHTALVGLRPGDAVNLEYDILGKYVVNYLQRREGQAEGLTEDFLREQGFM
jgi:riboflavin synthase